MGVDSNKSYPKASVITAYLYFGGAIGGGVIGLILAMLSVLETVLRNDFLQKIFFTLLLALLGIPICAFFGFIIGLIPATLTGFLVAHLKLYHNNKGLFQSATIGAISTVICALLLMVLADFTFSLAACAFATVIGSISGYLTGLSALPNE